MEELTEQIEQAIQIYFDRSGINDTARVAIFKKQPMLWEISVYTEHLLSQGSMYAIDGLVYLSVPFGVMHEVVNKISKEVASGHVMTLEKKLDGTESHTVEIPERTTVESVINQNGAQVEKTKKKRQ